MAADVDLCNEALSAIGVGDEIRELASESSKQAQACRRHFASCRDLVLRDFTWPRLRVVEALPLVAEDPQPQWKYAYRMPADAVTIIRLQVDASPRRDDTTSAIPYALGRDATGGLIYCDASTDDGVSAQYVFDETAIERWPADMREVLVNLLASKIAARFGPNAAKLGMFAYQLYERRRTIARAQALAEEVLDQPGDSDFVRARDGLTASSSLVSSR